MPEEKTANGSGNRFWATAGAAAVVVYAAALAILAVDTIFNAGIFPTAMDRKVAGLVQKLGSPDDRERQNAAVELVRLSDLAMEGLIKGLDDGSSPVREGSNECLKVITGFDAGYDPAADPAQRSEKIKAWHAWWKENRGKF
jgi:hypothetical protein